MMLPVFDYLETPRLRLRLITPELHHELFTHGTQMEIMEALGLISEEAFEKEQHKHEGGLTQFNRTMRWFTLLERETMRALGSAGFHNWMPEHRRAELGYSLHLESDMGKGYMTEAIQQFCNVVKKEFGIKTLEAKVFPGNEASMRALEKAGFIRDSGIQSYCNKNGKNYEAIKFEKIL